MTFNEEHALQITVRPTGVRVPIRVIARAPQDVITGIRAGLLLLKVTAPPEDGEANAAVIRMLSTYLRVAQSDLRIVTGETSRNKVIEVALTEAIFRQRLQTHALDCHVVGH